jgi:CRISPR/Cas system CSM-associated protein Csm3 (group 7 of RAMP superfamily)
MSNTQPSLARLQELEVRLYKLTTKSHLAIGSGEAVELSPVEKPIIRALIIGEKEDEKERVPYIPASSLHGVIRAWVEKAVRSLHGPIEDLKDKFENFLKNEPDAAAWLQQKVCADLDLPRNSSPDDIMSWELWTEVCNPFWEHDKCEYLADEAPDRPNPKRLWFEHIGRQVPCEACCLFGHPGQRGHVRFTHGFPPPAGTPLDVITRVAINRYTGAADPGKLFDLEAVPPGVVFHFFLILENLTEKAKGSLDWGIKALSRNLANLGAFGTVGFGLVELEERRRLLLKPAIFTLESIPDLAENSYPWPSDYDHRRYPQFFNFLARLTPNGALPPSVTSGMLEVKK